MIYSEIGRIAYAYWVEIPNHFPFVGLDKFIIMPNHVHGIIIIDKSNINVETLHPGVETLHPGVETLHPGVETLQCNVSTVKKNKFMSKISPKPGSISTIVRSYKSVVSKHAHKICIDFNWQPRFYDRIIRNDREFYNIQQYILHNSTQWEGDRNYQD